MDTGSARFNHGFHQLEGVEVSSEADFGIRNNGDKPVNVSIAIESLDLVTSEEGAVDSFDNIRDGVGRIEALVRIHLTSEVGISSDLPSGEINRGQTGSNFLHG